MTSSDAKQFVHKQAPENLNIRRTEEKIINLQNQRVAVIRPMELDLKCLKMTYWNKTYGIGPVNEIGIRPTDA